MFFFDVIQCFLYLFPSNQTWWLVATLVMLNATDWVCFLVLDVSPFSSVIFWTVVTDSIELCYHQLANSQILQINVGQRIVDGLFQGETSNTGPNG